MVDWCNLLAQTPGQTLTHRTGGGLSQVLTQVYRAGYLAQQQERLAASGFTRSQGDRAVDSGDLHLPKHAVLTNRLGHPTESLHTIGQAIPPANTMLALEKGGL